MGRYGLRGTSHERVPVHEDNLGGAGRTIDVPRRAPANQWPKSAASSSRARATRREARARKNSSAIPSGKCPYQPFASCALSFSRPRKTPADYRRELDLIPPRPRLATARRRGRSNAKPRQPSRTGIVLRFKRPASPGRSTAGSSWTARTRTRGRQPSRPTRWRWPALVQDDGLAFESAQRRAVGDDRRHPRHQTAGSFAVTKADAPCCCWSRDQFQHL